MSQHSVSRELEVEMFRCLNPQKPHMCDKEARMQTFPNSWYDQENPTPHELVDAGFMVWVLVTLSVVSIVKDNYFTGNCVTSRGTSMQTGFLCANLF